mmetsp:Transcript_13311/g.27591  ORF Transcript_13311/g.27591 Transcript_13311/m.27591 type:complete len:249 (-) Transcript_13311:537-1283(-)
MKANTLSLGSKVSTFDFLIHLEPTSSVEADSSLLARVSAKLSCVSNSLEFLDRTEWADVDCTECVEECTERTDSSLAVGPIECLFLAGRETGSIETTGVANPGVFRTVELADMVLETLPTEEENSMRFGRAMFSSNATGTLSGPTQEGPAKASSILSSPASRNTSRTRGPSKSSFVRGSGLLPPPAHSKCTGVLSPAEVSSVFPRGLTSTPLGAVAASLSSGISGRRNDSVDSRVCGLPMLESPSAWS